MVVSAFLLPPLGLEKSRSTLAALSSSLLRTVRVNAWAHLVAQAFISQRGVTAVFGTGPSLSRPMVTRGPPCILRPRVLPAYLRSQSPIHAPSSPQKEHPSMRKKEMNSTSLTFHISKSCTTVKNSTSLMMMDGITTHTGVVASSGSIIVGSTPPNACEKH